MPRLKGGFQAAQKKKAKSGNAMQRAAKEASDLAVANGDPNPTPVGRPRKQGGAAANQSLSSPAAAPRGSDKRSAAIRDGEDNGLIPPASGEKATKRPRRDDGAYAEDTDPCPLRYVAANEGEKRTAIKVLYLKLGAPPERDWWGKDGTINSICKNLKVAKTTVQDVLRRIQAAEDNKMDVDVSARCFAGTGGHNRRISGPKQCNT